MKLHRSGRATGSVAVVALVIIAILGLTLTSYLTLIQTQNLATLRSQAWNTGIAVSEAGIEEALSHLNKNGMASITADGWVLNGGAYTKSRSLNGGYWVTAISTNDPPSITSTGFVATVAHSMFGTYAAAIGLTGSTTNFTKRAILVNTAKDGLFTKAMVAKNTIDLKGNNIKTDSFDSSNPSYSSGGMYSSDPAKLRDNGDIATNSSITNSISVGNANVWGRASTGPGGSLSIGPNGAVGSKAWNMAGTHGVQSGWFKDDMNVAFPDITVPFTSGFTPVSGTVGGTTYKLVVNTGNYIIGDLNLTSSDQLYVNGIANLWVTNKISIKGNAKITIPTGSKLIIYMSGATAAIGGNGVANATGNAANFAFLGLSSHTSLTFNGNGTFTGVIYAPYADFSLGGGGSTDQDFIGASVTKTVTMNGHFKFHYDENLKNSQWSRGYVAISWDEI